MNFRFTFFLLVILLLSKVCNAQDSIAGTSHPPYFNHYLEINGGIKSEEGFGRLALIHLHGIGKNKQRLKIGYGISGIAYFGENQFYKTAPSRYTRPREDHLTAFSSEIKKNIDTVYFPFTQVTSINASFYIQYTILKRFDLGYTADVIGISFGPRKEGTVISSDYDGSDPFLERIEPTKFNMLLTSDNNIGSLHSEFYLRFWIINRLALRAGYSFLTKEYTTRQFLYFDNGRIVNDGFRHKSAMVSLGLTFRPFYKEKKS